MDAQLLGYLGEAQVAMKVAQDFASTDLFKNSKKAMMVFIDNNGATGAIPESVLAQLGPGGSLVVNNHIVYSVKKLARTTVKMFESGDKEVIGLSNLDGGKLEKDQHFCVTGIVLLYGTTANGTEDEALVADFNAITGKPALVNGVHRLKSASNKNIIDDIPNYVFDTPANGEHRMGYYELETPRLIEPQKEIKFEVEVPSLSGIDATKDFLKVFLIGAAFMPA